MVQLGNGVRLADEPDPKCFVVGDLGAQQLEGFGAGQAGVLDQVDLSHASRTQHSHDGVSSENLARPSVMGGILSVCWGVRAVWSYPAVVVHLSDKRSRRFRDAAAEVLELNFDYSIGRRPICR